LGQFKSRNGNGREKAQEAQRGEAAIKTERRFPTGFDRAMKEDFRVRSGIVRWPVFARPKPVGNRRSGSDTARRSPWKNPCGPRKF